MTAAAGPLVVETPGLGRVYDVHGTGTLLLPSVINGIDTVLNKPAIGYWRGKIVADAAFEQSAWLAALPFVRSGDRPLTGPIRIPEELTA